MRTRNKMSLLEKYGTKLIDQGYSVVPIKKGLKYPKGISKWQNSNYTKCDVKEWLSNGFADGGVGVLTKFTPVIDIDVLDDEIVQKLVK